MIKNSASQPLTSSVKAHGPSLSSRPIGLLELLGLLTSAPRVNCFCQDNRSKWNASARTTVPNGIHQAENTGSGHQRHHTELKLDSAHEESCNDDDNNNNVRSGVAAELRAMAMRRKFQQPEDSRRTLIARHGLAAAAAIAAEAAVSYPLDTLKALNQVSANAGKMKKGLDAGTLVSGIRKNAGLSGFYGGLGWHVLGRLPALGARFGAYELCCAFTTDGRDSKEVSTSEAFSAGLCAGVAEAFVATPFDMLKLRGQVAAITAPATTLSKPIWNQIEQTLIALPNVHPRTVPAIRDYAWLENGTGQPPMIRDVSGLKRLVDVEGVTVLWRGLRPGIFRDGLYGGVFFGGWHFLYEMMLEWKAFDMDPKPSSLEDIPPLKPWQLSVSAGIAASGAAAVSHALDTAKTRSQATVIPKHVAMERKLLKWVKPGTWLQRTAGILPFDQPMLWRGLRIRAFQHGVAAAALVGTYESAMHYFLRHTTKR